MFVNLYTYILVWQLKEQLNRSRKFGSYCALLFHHNAIIHFLFSVGRKGRVQRLLSLRSSPQLPAPLLCQPTPATGPWQETVTLTHLNCWYSDKPRQDFKPLNFSKGMDRTNVRDDEQLGLHSQSPFGRDRCTQESSYVQGFIWEGGGWGHSPLEISHQPYT